MINYNPDVLSCLANLSNDEVFTPPEKANEMLDLLPEELWSNPKAKFLDPFSKSGVFIREITKRLIKGLEKEFPDMQQRIDHILHEQVYGIAITELTSFISRRSLYCSKDASCKYSISHFDSPEGNIRYVEMKHTWEYGKCIYCGANQDTYDRSDEYESHAYEFIHTEDPNKIFNMKFDVIIGNPPYHLEVGQQKDNYGIPLYHKFVLKAKMLNPRYLSMIIPSRWFAGGRGLNEFRDTILNDKRIRVIVDYPNSTDCFPGIDLSGGVCYFLWDRDKMGDCLVKSCRGGKAISQMTRPLLEKGNNTFIRFNEAITILKKIQQYKENTFDALVSPQTPFGIVSSFKNTRMNHSPIVLLFTQ